MTKTIIYTCFLMIIFSCVKNENPTLDTNITSRVKSITIKSITLQNFRDTNNFWYNIESDSTNPDLTISAYFNDQIDSLNTDTIIDIDFSPVTFNTNININKHFFTLGNRISHLILVKEIDSNTYVNNAMIVELIPSDIIGVSDNSAISNQSTPSRFFTYTSDYVDMKLEIDYEY